MAGAGVMAVWTSDKDRSGLLTPNLQLAIAKALERAEQLGIDLASLADHVRNSPPQAINSDRVKSQRRTMLGAIYEAPEDAARAFERIIEGNELQDANFLARGALVARTVVRIVLRNEGGRTLGYGTGFLVGPGLMITNNHVLPDKGTARLSVVETRYERDLVGNEQVPQRYRLDPQTLFYTSQSLDFTLVALQQESAEQREGLARLGWLPLIGTLGKVVDGEWLTIIQHPNGEPKQLCVRENQLIRRDTDVLWYSTDTLAGSSGSPVFTNDWLVVALHHSGVPLMRNGRWQTIDGRDFVSGRDRENQIKWIANEGIRVSRIIETLRSDSEISSHPLIRQLSETEIDSLIGRLPVMYLEGYFPFEALSSAPIHTQPSQEIEMSRRLTITLDVDDDGSVSLVQSGREMLEPDERTPQRARKSKLVIDAPVIPEQDWIKGYDIGFLGRKEDHIVNLPDVMDTDRIAPLKTASVYNQPAPDAATAEKGVLHYNGYSVVMDKERRIAIYSAANIDGGMIPISVERQDSWLWDDRIARKHQIGNVFYANNKVDRGHLTRREDMEWGKDPIDATRRANGTCTWTNCAPQHELFNQDRHPNKAIRLWQGLEQYILEQTARIGRFKVQAFTGPIFSHDDPIYRDVAVPMEYWKIVAALDTNDRVFATGYVLSQQDVFDIDDLDEAAREQPFGQFQTYQRPITEIENATGLKFTFGKNRRPLSECDPLATTPVWRRRKRTGHASANEALTTYAGDGALAGFGDIELGSW